MAWGGADGHVTAVSNSTRTKLEAGRKDLLDLGLRNPLLNFRPLKSRGVEIVDELPAEVFRILVSEGKLMSFLPAPEKPAPSLLDGSDPPSPAEAMGQPDEEPGRGAAKRHVDNKLQTPLESARLQGRLLATYYAARSSIEEQGVNILYLALGMLEWFESPESADPRRAPLILVPVELQRTDAREKFRLRYTEEDIGPNLSLVEKVRLEFGAKLPPIPDLDDLEIDKYLAQVQRAVRGQDRWRVDERAISLGFFSFSKFLMYKDLDPSSWPTGAKIDQHPLITALMDGGFREDEPFLVQEGSIDETLISADAHHVVDADSSQALAILQVSNGKTLVIQGPPGTGKSQTITNLIAEALARKKTVLFVSEKMAALEVVKRRLDHIGMGDACLELHSHKANKKALLEELERTLSLGKPRTPKADADYEELGNARRRLNEYCEAVNSPIQPSAVTPQRALGAILRLQRGFGGTNPPLLEIKGIDEWADGVFRLRRNLAEELQSRLDTMGPPSLHAFRGSGRTSLLPSEERALRDSLAATLGMLQSRESKSDRLSGLLELSPPRDHVELNRVLVVAGRIEEAPDLTEADVRSEAWASRSKELGVLLQSGSARDVLRDKYHGTLIEKAWGIDAVALRGQLAELGGKWWRGLSGTYRSSRKQFATLLQGDPPRELDEVLGILDSIIEEQRHSGTIREYGQLGSSLFGSRWSSRKADWSSLQEIAAYLESVHREVASGNLPPETTATLADADRLAQTPEARADVLEAHGKCTTALADLIQMLAIDESVVFGENTLSTIPFDEQKTALQGWLDDLADLHEMVGFNVAADMCRSEGLENLVEFAEARSQASGSMVAVLEYAWNQALYERALVERPVLATFDGKQQESIQERFQTLDRIVLEHNRMRLAHVHWQGLPNGAITDNGAGQLGVLRKEFQKKRRHRAIRKLAEEAGNAIQAIKPVFMMSPLSVAAYLPPGSVTFDLVVFDEASQVKPVDALGAIARARQAVVVGDDRQLPPTSFFESMTVGEDPDDDETATSDIESVLGLFRSQGASEAMLRWHYRSRHESLIAVSNHEFYSNNLVVFPSPDGSRHRLGLVYRHLEGTAYERGRSRTNPKEAGAVAEAVMEHAHAQLVVPPEERLTLGVAAFSVAQMQAIQDQLEHRRRLDPTCEEFLAAHSHEPFFVKNLENVQGDERDVIFISVGYGKTEEGYLAMDFGPVNRDGGERRLNVLITRARIRCEVFTNLSADDIDLSRSKQRGVRALKTFLAYAESGRLDLPERTERDDESPFEDEVYASLAAEGYDVHRQIGTAGFFVDLAIKDPDTPGRYVLGIECDGATYHSARSARDRDRLRQQILEGLGWRIHRIWSTSWFRHPEKELKRVAEAIEQAKLAARVTSAARDHRSSTVTSTTVEREELTPDAAQVRRFPLYQLACPTIITRGLALHEVDSNQIADAAVSVINTESPVHIDEVCRRLAEAFGHQRVGSRIREAVERACALAAGSRRVRKVGDFYWTTSMTTPPARERSELPAASRKIELVAPEEIASAVAVVVADSCGIEADAVSPVVVKLLGFGRCSADMDEQVRAVIKKMVRKGTLGLQGKMLMAPGGRD